MVSFVQLILTEFREEASATLRVLERIPQDKLSWRPHPKSRPLGDLAMHVANVHAMAQNIATSDEFEAGRGSVTIPWTNGGRESFRLARAEQG